MKTVVRTSTQFDLQSIERETNVRQVVFRRVLQSTNDLALRLASRSDLAFPVLVLTEQQTGGRGRGTNLWWSTRGSLTFSLLLDAAPLHVPPDRWPQISLAAATAVCDAVDELTAPEETVAHALSSQWSSTETSRGAPGLANPLQRGLDSRCRIRWPNDVYLAGKKLCGILPESAPERESMPARLVLGIGINVNNSLGDAPKEVRDRGTSLGDLTAKHFELTRVLVKVLNRLDERLGQLARTDNRLADAWTARCMLRSHTVQLALGSRRVRGLCQGVNRDGALQLSIAARTERFFSGVITAVE